MGTLLSLFSVMYLKFVPKSHLFFTAGKDRKVKQWDADKFEHVQTLEVTTARRRSVALPLAEAGGRLRRGRSRSGVVSVPSLYRATTRKSGAWLSAPVETMWCHRPMTSL